MVFEQLFVNGIIAGSEYALLAIGLTLIFGILKLIHFAHGEVAMVGAYSAFAVSALFAGIAGSLFAHYITFIDPSSFTLAETILILLMVVLGGMGSLKGSVAGAIVLVLLPEPLRFIGLPSSMVGQLRQIIYAVLLIILMIKKPNGLLGEQWFGGIASEE